MRIRRLVPVLALTAVLVGACASDPTVAPLSSTTTAVPTTAVPTTSEPTTSAPPDCDPSAATTSTTHVYAHHDGADPELTSLDVYRPETDDACPPTPAMLWVHGGGWRTGDRGNDVDDKVRWFTERGWTFVSVNYRLSPEVSYPTHNEDVAESIAWVRTHAEELGIDPARISVLGHSAGAGILAAVAADPRYLAAHALAPDDLRCVVLVDSAGYDVAAEAGDGNEFYEEAFGSDPEVWRDASPIHHLGEAPPPAGYLVITRGPPRRVATARQYVDSLVAAGAEAQLLDANPLTHAQVNDVIGQRDDDLVTPALSASLDGCG